MRNNLYVVCNMHTFKFSLPYKLCIICVHCELIPQIAMQLTALTQLCIYISNAIQFEITNNDCSGLNIYHNNRRQTLSTNNNNYN